MSTWLEPSGFIVQMSPLRTNAIFPFAPGNVACALPGRQSTSAVTTRKIRIVDPMLLPSS